MSDLISRNELIYKIRGIVPGSQDVDFIVGLIENHHCCQRVSDDNDMCKRIDYEVEFYQYEKPDWCPLRELPEMKERLVATNDYDGGYSHGFTHGYNACIDELLKGEKG